MAESFGFPSGFDPFRATRNWSVWPTRPPPVDQDPRDMTAKDWYNVLYPLPVWRGWRVEEVDESLAQANDPAFEPNPRRAVPSWENVPGSGKKRCWRIESQFDRTVSDNGFQDWSAHAAFEPFIWKLKLFSLRGGVSKKTSVTSTDKVTAKYEGFMVKAMFPRVKIHMIADHLVRLTPACKAHLEELRFSGSQELLWRFISRYGEWFSPTFTLGGYLSHYYSATTIKGQTMDEKEREIMAGISAGAAFVSTAFPLGFRNNSTSTDNQSMLVDKSCLETFGGARRYARIEEWEQSLENPRTWGVIERERPQPLFDIIAHMSGWEWLNETVKGITSYIPPPRLLPPTRQSQYFSENTSIACGVVPYSRGLTCLFFQDHQGWIRWGVYYPRSDKELIFAKPIAKAKESSPIATSLNADRHTDQHTGPQVRTIHLFFLSDNGILTDFSATISPSFPPSVTDWAPGTLEQLELRVHPRSKIAASYYRDEDNYQTVVVFQQDSPLRTHLFEATREGDQAWTVLPRPHHQLESVRGGPLHVYHPGYEPEVLILYHSETNGGLVSAKAGLNLETPYTTEEVVPASHLPTDMRTNSYRGARAASFAVNPYLGNGKRIYTGLRNDDDTIDIIFWHFEEDAGRTMKRLTRVCQTRSQSDFCLAHARKRRLLVFYINLSGQMEVAVVDPERHSTFGERLAPRPIFLDCCSRQLADSGNEEGSDASDTESSGSSTS